MEGTTEELFQQVFSNPLVTERIVGFLHLTDMKMASEVSHSFLNIIRSTQRYQGLTMLKIDKENLEMNPRFKYLEIALSRDPWHWKGLIVDLNEIRDWHGVHRMMHFLKNKDKTAIHALKFIGGKLIDVQTAVGVLKELFSVLKGINDLKIDLEFLKRMLPYFQDFISEPEVSDLFPRLRELDIILTPFRDPDPCPFTPQSRFLDGDLRGLQIPQIYPGLDKLQVLKVHFDFFCKETTHHAVLSLIRANAFTLEELLLEIGIWDTDISVIEGLGEVHCQRLTRLSLRIVGGTENDVVKAVEAQPLLQHLHLDYSRGGISLTATTWDTIKARGNKLKSLHFHMNLNNVGHLSDIDQVYDWSFLSQLEELKDFSFVLDEDMLGFPEEGGRIPPLFSMILQ